MLYAYRFETLIVFVFLFVLWISLEVFQHLKKEKAAKEYAAELAARKAAREAARKREEDLKNSARAKFEVARMRRKLYDVEYVTETTATAFDILPDQYKDTDQEGYTHCENDAVYFYNVLSVTCWDFGYLAIDGRYAFGNVPLVLEKLGKSQS